MNRGGQTARCQRPLRFLGGNQRAEGRAIQNSQARWRRLFGVHSPVERGSQWSGIECSMAPEPLRNSWWRPAAPVKITGVGGLFMKPLREQQGAVVEGIP